MLNVDTRLIHEYKVTSDEYFLLSILTDMTGKNRECWPQTSTLLKICGWSKSTLLRVKASLKEKGLIEITQRRKSNNQMQFDSSLYTIKTPLIKKFNGDSEPRSNSDPSTNSDTTHLVSLVTPPSVKNETTLVSLMTPPSVKNEPISIRKEVLSNGSIRKEVLQSAPSKVSLDFSAVRQALVGDEVWLEGIKMAYRGVDLEQALKECFIHHSALPTPPRELWQWRQKFNTWLSIKFSSGQKSSNGKSTNAKIEHGRILAEDFARRYGS